MTATLYTIGFTRKGAQLFFELLAHAGVTRVLDVRAHPDSQLAGFARGKDLAWMLKHHYQIDYLRVPALAPGKQLLADYRKHTVDWPSYEARYLGELRPDLVAQQLIGVPLDRACLLCAEDSAEHCHRRLAAQWLQQRNEALQIQHLA